MRNRITRRIQAMLLCALAIVMRAISKSATIHILPIVALVVLEVIWMELEAKERRYRP